MQQYANTLQKMIEMAGFRDTRSFINPPSQVAEITQQLAQEQQNQQPQIDPVVAAQIERDRLKLESDIALARERAQAELALKREEMLASIEIKKAELDLKKQELVEEAKLEAIKMAANLPGGQGNITSVT